MKLKHIAHIDGLRAIAIFSVVMNHLGFSWIPGGFVGVDVFFVISGFVITLSLKERLCNDEFSFIDFYDRRVRRIFPALMLVIAVALAYGYFSLPPGDYSSLGSSAMNSALFLANVYFLNNTGYFDAAASTLPLLHLWSLAVEEQFYIVWPVVTLFLFKMTKFRGLVFVMLLFILFVGSLIACLYITMHEAKDAFYLSQYRGWEFLLGAYLAFTHERLNLTPGSSRFLGIIGYSGIAYGLFVVSETDPFPGYNAIPPSIGALLIIVSGLKSKWFGMRFLFLSIPSFFGKISYSLYLWHWPIIVFYIQYKGGETLSVSEKIWIFVVAIVVSAFSFYLIENPFRYMKMNALRRLPIGVIGAAIIAITGKMVNAHDGFPDRIPENMLGLSSLEVMWEWKCNEYRPINGLQNQDLCIIGANWDTADKYGILWGDSHAEHFAPLINEVAKKQNLSILLWRGCPAYVNQDVKIYRKGDSQHQSRCEKSRKEIEKWIVQNQFIKTLILAGAWNGQPEYLYTSNDETRSRERGLGLMHNAFVGLIESLPASIDSIVVLGDVPRFMYDPVRCAFRRGAQLIQKNCNLDQLSSADALQRHSDTDSVLLGLKSIDKRVVVVPTVERMCSNEQCLTYVGNEFLYRDLHHLRRNIGSESRATIINTVKLDEAIATVHMGRRN